MDASIFCLEKHCPIAIHAKKERGFVINEKTIIIPNKIANAITKSEYP